MESTKLVVAEKSHAELGASIAHRWMNCPGSVRMSRGRENTQSEYAKEGQAAHALGELCLRRGVAPETFVGTTLEGVEVSDEMAEHVKVYVDYCAGFDNGQCDVSVEQQFSLGALNPPGPMFGTADFVWVHPESDSMGVVDLKYGQGVVIAVKGSKQLRYYALGAVLSLGWAPSSITMTIVQPRVMHPDGVIRSETIPLAELIDFAGELLNAARATQALDAPLVAGAWCRFCPASGSCPAQLAHAQEIAQVEFGVVDAPPAPETLPPELFAEILTKLPLLEQWITDMHATAKARLEAGEEVPGYKLVARRATRYWSNTSEAEQYLRALGYDDAEIHEMKLKSPAQIEKLVGKKNLPKDLWEKRSSGYSMVPVHDPRAPIMVTAGDEFFALPSGEDTQQDRSRDASE